MTCGIISTSLFIMNYLRKLQAISLLITCTHLTCVLKKKLKKNSVIFNRKNRNKFVVLTHAKWTLFNVTLFRHRIERQK